MGNNFTLEETNLIGNLIGVDWVKHDQEQFRAGLLAELDFKKLIPGTIVSNIELILTGKIVHKKLNFAPGYYNDQHKTGESSDEPAKHESMRYAVDATADSIVDPPLTETYAGNYRQNRTENRRDNKIIKLDD